MRRAVLVVSSSAWLFAVAGCGLTLDYGPPDMDAGSRDAAAMDAATTDSGLHSRCFGMPDGADCTPSNGASRRICIAQRCVPSSCGDGYVDTTSSEQCEPAADTTCGAMCRYECVTGADCVAPSPCVTSACVSHQCTFDPSGHDMGCTLATGQAGLCSQGLCVAPGCGNHVVETGEDCDPGSASATGCTACRFDCASNSDCSDGDPCTGDETCMAIGTAGGTVTGKTCVAGTPFMCGDPTRCFTVECITDRSGVAACAHQLIDPDHDGYSAFDTCDMGAPGGDCNDMDPNVHPGATEVCNGMDDDCNGVIDDDTMAVTWCLDMDGDGYGAPDAVVVACAQPGLRYVRDCTDCFDDGDSTRLAEAALVHPGQLRFFDTPYCPTGPTSCTYDYDCDGHGVPQSTRLVMCGALAPLICATSAGWQSTVPACGASGTFATCHPAVLGLLCQSNTTSEVQACH